MNALNFPKSFSLKKVYEKNHAASCIEIRASPNVANPNIHATFTDVGKINKNKTFLITTVTSHLQLSA